MTADHYIIFTVAALFICWVIISLIDMLERKKELRAKKETWGKFNEVSRKLTVEKSLKAWKRVGNSNKKKENIQ